MQACEKRVLALIEASSVKVLQHVDEVSRDTGKLALLLGLCPQNFAHNGSTAALQPRLLQHHWPSLQASTHINCGR